MSALEVMFQQVEDQDLAAGLKEFVSTGDGLRRIGRVVQSLAEDHLVNAFRVNGRLLEIAETKLQVFEVVFFGLSRAERYNFFGVIHGNDLFAAAGQEFAQQSLA